MFKFLKDKLKGAVDRFSKKVEKEVPEEKVEEIKEEIAEEVEEEKKVETDEVKITYFVHGITTDNEKDLATGWSPGELSGLGVKQAKELGKLVINRNFDVVFCSDLKRAVDSAELGFGNKYEIIQDKKLRECDYGDFTEKPVKEFKNDMGKYVDNSFPNGESYKDVEERIREFLNDLYKKYKRKHVAIVAHQAPQLAMEVLLKNKTWGEAIDEDWRKKKDWKPGWEYVIKSELTKPKEKKSILKKIKETVSTKKISEGKFENLFEDMEMVLLENNVAVEVIDKIKRDLKVDLVDVPIKRSEIGNKVNDSLKDSIKELFKDKLDLINEIKESDKPYVIVFVGVNGSGKTTTIAKFVKLLEDNGLSSVIAASDTFRAAAIHQLEEHGNKLNVRVIKHDYGADPAAVAFDARKYAEAKKIDVVLDDTAGRLHSNVNLMDEMKKIIRVVKPNLKVFVGESITGNDCVVQSKKFNDEVGIDAVVLSKADIDEKGGATISISYVTNKPIIYLGNGQGYSDLEEFNEKKLLEGLGFDSGS